MKHKIQGSVSVWRYCLCSIGIPIIKIRRSHDHDNSYICIRKDNLNIETDPRSHIECNPSHIVVSSLAVAAKIHVRRGGPDVPTKAFQIAMDQTQQFVHSKEHDDIDTLSEVNCLICLNVLTQITMFMRLSLGSPGACFTNEIDSNLIKPPLKFSGGLDKLSLAFLIKWANGVV